MRARERVLVAFVVRGAAGAAIDALRAACGSTEIERIAPHATIVPPFNVSADALETTCAAIERVASRAAPIGCRIAGAGTFPPEDRVLYLAVAEGGDRGDPKAGGRTPALAGLAAECAAAAGVAVTRPFVAHITLASPASAAVVASARPLVGRVALDVIVDRVSVFRHDAATRRWGAVDEVDLGSAWRVAAGALDLELAVASRVSEGDRAFLAALDVAGPPVDATAVVVRGRAAGARVGVLAARRDGSRVVVDAVAVTAGARAQGVGRRLVRHLERWAEALGVHEVVAEGAGVPYFSSLGYRPGAARAVRELGP